MINSNAVLEKTALNLQAVKFLSLKDYSLINEFLHFLEYI